MAPLGGGPIETEWLGTWLLLVGEEERGEGEGREGREGREGWEKEGDPIKIIACCCCKGDT